MEDEVKVILRTLCGCEQTIYKRRKDMGRAVVVEIAPAKRVQGVYVSSVRRFKYDGKKSTGELVYLEEPS